MCETDFFFPLPYILLPPSSKKNPNTKTIDSIGRSLNQNIKHIKKIQKPLMMLWASIFQLPKRSYFNKHISYLLKTKIPSLWLRSARPLLTVDIGGHIRCESVAKGCSKAITLVGEVYFWRMHVGREQARSGFTLPWLTNSVTLLTQRAHCLWDLLEINVISSSKPHSKCSKRNQVSKNKYQLSS